MAFGALHPETAKVETIARIDDAVRDLQRLRDIIRANWPAGAGAEQAKRPAQTG